jgi:hypothetical protein
MYVCLHALQGRGGEDWGIELARALEASLVGSPAGGETQQQHRCCRAVAAQQGLHSSSSSSSSVFDSGHGSSWQQLAASCSNSIDDKASTDSRAAVHVH